MAAKVASGVGLVPRSDSPTQALQLGEVDLGPGIRARGRGTGKGTSGGEW